MRYSISGRFVEACDCRVICPCWISLDPDNGSCTGFFAWRIDHGSVEDQNVAGSSVISVSTHLGGRQVGTDTSGSAGGVAMLFVDAPDDAKFKAVASAFTSITDGPIADIISVIASPALVDPQRAEITISSTSVKLSGVDAQPDSRIDAAIEPVVGADHRQVVVRHQVLDPTLEELFVARNTSMDLGIVDPNPENKTELAGTYLFDFTKQDYSASTGHFTYRWPKP
jgi:hypothetical protein